MAMIDGADSESKLTNQKHKVVQILTPNCDQIELEQGLIVTERVKRIVELEQEQKQKQE